MSEWTNPLIGMGVFLLLAAWFLYGALRPVRDYYVLQRLYFERLYEHPWRGPLFAAHYHAFSDYHAAKVVYDRHDIDFMSSLDTAQQEAEHTLFVIPARSKSAAIARLKADKAYGKELLHKTPYDQILRRREYWQKATREAFAYTAEQITDA